MSFSYPKIYNIGHAAVTDLFAGAVVVEEKVDGSQFRFGIIDGKYRCWSKGKEQTDAPDKMFEVAVEMTENLPLHPDWIYCGEYLSRPKHNTLAYDRVPKNHIVIFDIFRHGQHYYCPADKALEASRLGFETVPLLLVDTVFTSVHDIVALLDTPSFLGGTLIEGFVVKNYSQFTRDGKVMMGKFVSERFKEKNAKDYRLRNPAKSEVIGALGDQLRTEARWDKAIQHLREGGVLQQSPRDIGPLIKEIQRDVHDEEKEHIQDVLFKHAWGTISRRVIAGFPEYYKKKLAEEAFK